jgi:hypothetical protein
MDSIRFGMTYKHEQVSRRRIDITSEEFNPQIQPEEPGVVYAYGLTKPNKGVSEDVAGTLYQELKIEKGTQNNRRGRHHNTVTCSGLDPCTGKRLYSITFDTSGRKPGEISWKDSYDVPELSRNRFTMDGMAQFNHPDVQRLLTPSKKVRLKRATTNRFRNSN